MLVLALYCLFNQGVAAFTPSTADADIVAVKGTADGPSQRVKIRKIWSPKLTYLETNCIPATSQLCLYHEEANEWLTPPDSGALDFFRSEFSPNPQILNRSRPIGHFELTFNSTGQNFTLEENSSPTTPSSSAEVVVEELKPQNSGSMGFIPILFKPNHEFPYPGRPTGNVDLTHNSNGLYDKQVEGKPTITTGSFIINDKTKPPKFKPSPQIPYPAIHTGHLDLTYNPNGLEVVEGMKPPKFNPNSQQPYPGNPTGHIDLTYNSSGIHFTVEDSRPAAGHVGTSEGTTSNSISKPITSGTVTEGKLESTTAPSSAGLESKPSTPGNVLVAQDTASSPVTPATVIELMTNASITTSGEQD